MELKPIAWALATVFPLAAHAASDPELQAMREELRRMKADYERRIDALEKRLAAAEATPRAIAVPQAASASPPAHAAPAEPAMRPEAHADGFNPEISLTLQGRAKSMQDIPERNITGYWPAGDDHGEKRGFSVDHTELAFVANIDTLFRGVARFAVVDNEVEVEEAYFSTLGLGGGLGLKGGRFRSEIGYINVQHPHEWDFADAPLMQKALFGAEGYRQDGLQLKWVAPTEFFLQFGAEIGRGDRFPGTERNRTGPGSGAVFAKLGGDIGSSHAWQGGISYLATRAVERPAHAEDTDPAGPNEVTAQFSGRSRAWVADFIWKWAPDGNPRERNVKLQAEYFRRSEDGSLACSSDIGRSPCIGATGGLALGDYQTRQSGGYVQGVWQFVPGWRVGARYDWLSPGTKHYDEATVFAALDPTGPLFSPYRPKRSSVMLDWTPSENSRLRLQYARDTAMADVTDNQVTLQYIMSMGAHGAHKF